MRIERRVLQGAVAGICAAFAAGAIGACSLIDTDDLTGGTDSSIATDGPGATQADGAVGDSTVGAPDPFVDGPSGDDTLDGTIVQNDGTADGGQVTYAQLILSENPVAYWRMGDVGVIAHSEVGDGGYEGAYSGNYTLGIPGAIDGDPDTAVHFGGTLGSMVVGNVLAFDDGAPFTFELWLRVPAADGIYRRLLGREGPSGDSYSFLYEESQPGLGFGFGGAATGGVQGMGAIPVNLWNHVVVTFDGSVLYLYTNGIPTGVSTITSPIEDGGSNSFRLASDMYNASELNGDVDEVAVYDKALDAGTIIQHFMAAGPHDAAVLDASADH